jgi:membrane fusion protein
LFRREAVEAQASHKLGEISLAQPLRYWILAGLAVLVAVMLILALVLGRYSRRTAVVGRLVPDLGLSTLLAPTDGVVGRLFPREGARVLRGAPLARIDVSRALSDGDDSLPLIRTALAQRERSLGRLARSQSEQNQAQLEGTRRQVDSVGRELAQIDREIASRNDQLALGRDIISRYREVAAAGYVSRLQIAQQEQSQLELLGQKQALQRQHIALQRGLAQMQQSLAELPAQRESLAANIQRDRALLDQERVQQEASGEVLLKAPVTGLVASRLIEPGQAVSNGQPLLSLLPEGSKLQAQLLVPSRAIGFINPGDVVLLSYPAFPHQKFGHQRGRIIRVSRSALDPTGALRPGGSAPADNDEYFRVLVQLDRQDILVYGQPEALRPGMSVQAQILGERRRLYEWLFEPLYTLSGTFGQ